MKIIQDDLWLCVDCLMAAVNGDVTGIDSDKRVAEVWAGLEKLGANLVPNFDSETGEGIEEFARRDCDSCHSGLAGGFHRFATLGPDDYEQCGECGFDHAYEPSEAQASHVEMKKVDAAMAEYEMRNKP